MGIYEHKRPEASLKNDMEWPENEFLLVVGALVLCIGVANTKLPAIAIEDGQVTSRFFPNLRLQ
jgi:hypothetical protein